VQSIIRRGERVVLVASVKTVQHPFDEMAVYDDDKLVMATALNLDLYGLTKDSDSK
jgi:hypothetical protein